MKKIYTIITVLITLILLASCSGYSKSDLTFYVVKRADIEGITDKNELIYLAKANGRLAFDGNDIEGYNWQTHTVFLKHDSVPSLGNVTNESGGSAIFKTDDTYAFVLILKNTVIYTGGFKAGTRNPSVPLQPFIQDNNRYSFTLEFDLKYATTTDNRTNSKLYRFLNDNGLLSSKTT